MAPVILLFTLLLPITCVSAVDVSKLVVDTVPCNETTTSCECRQKADVCIFSFKIERRQSFTRYYIGPQSTKQATATVGRPFYFDDDGKLHPHLGPLNPYCKDATEGDVSKCTPTYTLDGSTYRSFIAVNGQIPGPKLIVWENQTVVVNVSNQLQMETISIHWHGMYQRNTYFMDGVQHITQFGIDPLKSFRYMFKAIPSGTFWYHSHTGTQLSDGLVGGLIIRESPGKQEQIQQALDPHLLPYQDKPAEHTLVISDWYREDGMTDYSLLASGCWFYNHSQESPPGRNDKLQNFSYGPDGEEAGNYPFWSALINGKGKHPDNQYPYLKSRLSVFSVDPGKVYRFRLIGAINNYLFRFSIDEHKLWVVGTDGHWIQPVPVDYIALQSGERYDFLLITKRTSHLQAIDKHNYWIRAETQETDADVKNPTGPAPYRMKLDHVAEAILHYKMPGVSLPTSADYVSIKEKSTPVNSTCKLSNRCVMLNCPWNIHPAYNLTCRYVDSLRHLLPSPENILPKATPDEVIFFQFGTEGVAGVSSVNGRRLQFPSVPPRLTVNNQEFQEIYDREYCKNLSDPDLCYDISQKVSDPDCWCVHMRNLEYRKSYRFVYTVVGPHGAFSHPIHMHGHSFFVVKIGLPPINSTTGFVDCFSGDIDCSRYPTGFKKCDYVTNPNANYTCPAPKWAPGQKYSYPSATSNGTIPTPTPSGKIDPYTPRKDTILVPEGGYAIVDVVADNPGIWFMHCHVENHQAEGMEVIINEAQPHQNPSPAKMRQYGNYGLTLQEFYDLLEFNPDNPPTSSPPPPPATCAAAGFTSGCCREPGDKCYLPAGECWCDEMCHKYHNCCPDVGCPKRKSVWQ